MANESILIVDDNFQNLKLARLVLEADGYVVHIVHDAEEALGVLPELRPQLVLMDLQLPRMDGLELTRMLKGDPRFADIIILAWTAYAMKGDEEKAGAAGCDGYLSKPVDVETLSKTVARHFAIARQRRQIC